MKKAYFPGILILLALLIGSQKPGYSQQAVTADEFNPDNAGEQGKLISTYREFFKWEEYRNAMESWWALFNDYPDASERLYVDGVTMYRHFIEETPDGQSVNGMVDTLMLIYDQRMEYFGGEGSILGRKGCDLLRYRSSEKEQVQAAYGMLKRSLEMEGTNSREPVVGNFITAGLILQQQDVIDNIQVMEDYFMVTGLLDELEGTSSRWKRTRSSIDEMILKADILSCVGLDLYFVTRFDQNSEDRELLEKIIYYYSGTDCRESDLYSAASEKLFELDPGPESAHNLAMLFIGREDLEKAANYLKLAVAGENIEDETRAEWFYELSVVYLAIGDHCGAIEFAREAIAFKSDYGKAYLALGDAIITARKELGEDIQQRCAYWAAADMYQRAGAVDPALIAEAREKLSLCSSQYPLKEDLFFHELHNGDSYRVQGCIQANTTVRSRD